MQLEPDIGGVCSGSMMMKPIWARGSFGGTSRLTWRKTPPRGSFSTKLRSVWSAAIQRDCSQSVSPGGGGTPPTMTSPTSPSAWQLTTWMIFAAFIAFPIAAPAFAYASATCSDTLKLRFRISAT